MPKEPRECLTIISG
jgi:hypothetical protein